MRLQAADGPNWFMVGPLCIEAASILHYRNKTLNTCKELSLALYIYTYLALLNALCFYISFAFIMVHFKG